MLKKVKELTLASRIQKMLKRHCIEIVHYIPGRIRLQSIFWKNNYDTVGQLICHFENEARIYSVQYTPETGSLVFTYDGSLADNVKLLEAWAEKIERILLKGKY
ncbi:HMA2 domain-containing protein [Neobacillus massiliamazoniensis]|jgi:hypothetical protein|uniref:Putative cation transporting ATPase n=1 Tax=Neobacillus massiliamazoniensis TaxID=1499688 RepID=A0A0U1NTS1_9BACI|nr:hypothetical protein [Neobacillus massiliamazoniensis]CRK81433.1 putative cation transporting ATPase [Neobacillus massiliamazoniensis]